MNNKLIIDYDFELEERIRKTYSQLFDETSIIEIPIGWGKLVEDLLKYLSTLNLTVYDEINNIEIYHKLKILQIKEKFGELRVYYIVLDEDETTEENFETISAYNHLLGEIEGAINFAAWQSKHICQITGERGEIRNINGRLIVLSDKEYEKLFV